MRRAVVFDFGGVLMKTVDYTPRQRWDDRLGLPHGSIERIVHNSTSWIKAQTGALTLEQYWADIAAKLKISAKFTQQLATDFYSGDQLDAALIAYIRQLRQAGHAVAMLSNNSIDLIDTLKREAIFDLFNPLVVSAEIGVLKPDAAAYTALLGQLQRPADEVIFIDDAPANIAGANAVGLQGVQYINGMDLPAALNGLLHIE